MLRPETRSQQEYRRIKGINHFVKSFLCTDEKIKEDFKIIICLRREYPKYDILVLALELPPCAIVLASRHFIRTLLERFATKKINHFGRRRLGKSENDQKMDLTFKPV